MAEKFVFLGSDWQYRDTFPFYCVTGTCVGGDGELRFFLTPYKSGPMMIVTWTSMQSANWTHIGEAPSVTT